jgi:glycosyltransferase involved in cell wall biosynthesis
MEQVINDIVLKHLGFKELLKRLDVKMTNLSKSPFTLGGMNKISVVIPTLNRPKHLKNAIHSILAQTRLPDEIIVVDQSDNLETEDLITRERSVLTKKVSLKYIFEREKSASHARNVGWRAATGQIVIFVDDDLILDTHYISEILRVYREHPHAVGVQGIWSGWPYYWPAWKGRASFIPILFNYIRKVFLVTHWEKDSQRILPSQGIVVPYPLTKTIEAGLILTGLASFRKVIDEDSCWDENLKGYSWGEESFTIKLNRRYPHSLYVTPFAKAIHDTSSGGRPQTKKLYYITTQYELYNFYNYYINPLDGSSLRNWIAFFWKTVGKIVMLIAGSHRKEYRLRLLYTVQSYLWALSHFDEVRTGKFNLT